MSECGRGYDVVLLVWCKKYALKLWRHIKKFVFGVLCKAFMVIPAIGIYTFKIEFYK